MATMFPKHIIDDTHSSAERKLFSLFERQLEPEFTVFHSVAWLARSDRGRAFDGEADFIITHPHLGLLVLEVKGGRIYYDGSIGKWFSVDRNNVTYQLSKDPVTQAKNARYNLYRKLQDSPLTCDNAYPVCHAVCFPDVTADQNLRLDCPQEIILDQARLINPQKSVLEIFEYWDQRAGKNGPGRKGIEALIELLAPRIKLRSYMSSEFAAEAEVLKQLTEQQFIALDLLSRERRAIIYGCAGSGKTLLALEKARRLANEGYSVLFTCFNTRLADWLNTTQYAQSGVRITSFHKLCIDTAKRASIAIPPLQSDAVQGDDKYYFGSVLPEALLDAATKLGPQHDAVIVDEGQDFEDSWWIALESLLLHPSDDIFYIFCDDNQNIYAGADQEYPFRSPSVTLNRNCRNTQEIHKVVSRYYRGSVQIQALGPNGRAPQILTVKSPTDLPHVLEKCLNNLISVEQIPSSDIAVLTPRSERLSVLRPDTGLGRYWLTWQFATRDNEIECSSIHGFKGLERSVIFLAELEHADFDKDKLVYIGASRARNLLIVLGALP